MKRLLCGLTLALVACASTPEMIPTEGPVSSLVERVVERHDSYVEADGSLSPEAKGAALAESAGASALMALPEISGSMLSKSMEPVMQRHDAYVSADASLDDLERGIYLESTERLRSLIASVPSPVSVE